MPVPQRFLLRLEGQYVRDLEEIARRRGLTCAEAARQSIAETAARERRPRAIAAEATSLMNDPLYVQEVKDMAALMGRPASYVGRFLGDAVGPSPR